jgi:heterogeneous nuclear ribonucleoprotein A1
MKTKNKERACLALTELEKEMEILTKKQMNACKGGGYGTYNNPWTLEEFYYLESLGIKLKGYVNGPDGTEYIEMLDPVTVYGNFSTGNKFEGMDIQNKRYMYEQYQKQGYTSGWFGFSSYGGGGGYTQPDPIKDGVDITNSKHFTFNTGTNAAFDSQLKDILSTNKTIKGLLSYFDKGYVHLTFGIENLGRSTAYTKYVSPESYHINFNSNQINQDGFHWNPETDNIGYDYSKTRDNMERLVVVIAHEAIHAKHYAAYEDAVREARGFPHTAANRLLQSGYSQEFVEIYFVKNLNGEWDYNRDGKSNDRAHEYMRKYDHGVIDKALEEYRKDRQ